MVLYQWLCFLNVLTWYKDRFINRNGKIVLSIRLSVSNAKPDLCWRLDLRKMMELIITDKPRKEDDEKILTGIRNYNFQFIEKTLKPISVYLKGEN